MSLVLTEEQESLKSSVDRFVADKGDINALRELRARREGPGFDPVLWQQAVALGWAAIPFAEEYGGLGLGFAELGVVLEGLGRKLVPLPLYSGVVLGGGAVVASGSKEHAEALLPSVCDGSLLLALAWQETPRHELWRVDASAAATNGGYQLNGSKVLVLDAASADKLIVLARTSGGATDRDGLTLFVVDADQTGIRMQRNVLLDSRTASTVHFDNVRVSGDAVLGSVGGAAKTLEEVFAQAAVALSAEMLGGIQQSFDTTLEYLKVREQFGALIGSFQGLKHRAARWFCEVELTRSIVLQALRALDDGDDRRYLLASACKARASDTYHLCGKEGVQMHGGIGVTDEMDIGFYMKRARVAELLMGDAAFHRQQYAALEGF